MSDGEDQRGSLLDPERLRHLFGQLQATNVDELEVVFGSSRLYLRRDPGKSTRPSTEGQAAMPPDGVPVVAPLHGVFYARPSPEEPPFVVPGDVVAAGQVVGLIEKMKMMNNVTVDMEGEVLSVDAQDGELVQTGQPLLFLRPTTPGGPSAEYPSSMEGELP